MRLPILTLTVGLLAGFIIGLLAGPNQKDSDMRRVAEIQHMIALASQYEIGNRAEAQKSIFDLSESTLAKIDDPKVKAALEGSLARYRQTIQKTK